MKVTALSMDVHSGSFGGAFDFIFSQRPGEGGTNGQMVGGLDQKPGGPCRLLLSAEGGRDEDRGQRGSEAGERDDPVRPSAKGADVSEVVGSGLRCLCGVGEKADAGVGQRLGRGFGHVGSRAP